MNKLKAVFFITFLLTSFLVSGLYWIRNKATHASREKEILEPATEADLSIKGLDYVQTNNGVKEWRLTATAAHFLKKNNQTRLENVKLTYFTEDRKKVVLTGKVGILNTKTLDVAVWGGVEVLTEDGYHFRAPSVKYLAKIKEIRSAHQVLLKGPHFKVTGKGMRVCLNQGKFFILEQVSATVEGMLQWRREG